MTAAELVDATARPPYREAGRSVLGRPIGVVELRGGGPDASALLLFGGIHGDEPLGAYVCLRFVEHLQADPAPLAASGFGRVIVLPAANPDGMVAGTKNNARDVDLNRNFAARSWTREHQPRYDPGPAPESEPETRLLAGLVATNDARRIVSLHSPFRVVNYDGPAATLAARMAAACGYPVSGDIGYPTPGSFGSRYGIDEGREVVTLEIPPMTHEQAWMAHRATLLAALAD